MADLSESSDTDIYEVETILDHRGRGRNIEYLVKWRGFGEEEDSWEPAANLFSANEVVEAYRIREGLTKTPRRLSKSRSKEKVPNSQAMAEKEVVQRTVTSTKTETIKSVSSGDLSPDASPVATRRSSKPVKTFESRTSTQTITRKSAGSPRTSSPVSHSSLRTVTSGPRRLREYLQFTSRDISIAVVITCVFVIFISFIVSDN